MKKIYTFAMAALLTAGAASAQKQQAKDIVVKDNLKTTSVAKAADAFGAKRVAKKAASASLDEFNDTFDWTYGWLLSSESGPATAKIKVVDEATGEVAISLVPGQPLVVKGYIDLENSTFTIPNDQFIGVDTYGYDNYFYLKDVNTNTGQVLLGKNDQEASVGVISGTTVTFPDLDIWAIGDYNNEIGFWIMTYSNKFSLPKPIDEEQEGQWKSIGTCTLEDAWVTPGFNYQGAICNPADYLIHAELQQNLENENLYRVWRPYHDQDWELVATNESRYNGQIVFDITDPDHVIVYPGYYAGYGDADGEYCVFGLLGWQLFDYDYDDEDLEWIYAFMEENEQPFDTYKDGVLSVNLSVFDFNIACNSAYAWDTDSYVVSKITFPIEETAVEGVEVENAPVKYFNLQGVEIANPEAGQIVIRRQGDKAAKIINK